MNARDATAGFTLLEVLAAATIAALLAGLALAVTDRALQQWRRMEGGFSTITAGRLVLDQIERDFQAACAPGGNGRWLQLTVVDSTAALAHRGWVTQAAKLRPPEASVRVAPRGGDSPDPLRAARFGTAGAWLKLLTTTAESAGEPALPRAIAWQIARRPINGPINADNPAPVRYTLFRSAVTALDTFRQGYDLGAAGYASNASTPAPTRAPATLGNPNNVDAFAANIVDLGIWLYRRDAAGNLLRIFPVDEDDREHSAAAASESRPEVADVMVRILTDEGAARLAALESGRTPRPAEHASDGDWWWAVVEENSRVLTRRIELKGAP